MSERSARQLALLGIYLVWVSFMITSFIRHDEIDPYIWAVPTAATVVLHTKKEDEDG